MADNYGTDLAMISAAGALDLDATLRVESDPGRLLMLAAARRLSTPTGALVRHPLYGLDLRALVNDSFDAVSLRSLRAAIIRQVEQDERVARASCVVDFNRSTETMRVKLSLLAATGQVFERVLAVSAVSVELLEQ